MENKYLDKVVDQIVRETTIDYDEERLYTPFTPSRLHLLYLNTIINYPNYIPFSHHCEEVYGLNDDEIDYVWNEYRIIIGDKIS